MSGNEFCLLPVIPLSHRSRALFCFENLFSGIPCFRESGDDWARYWRLAKRGVTERFSHAWRTSFQNRFGTLIDQHGIIVNCPERPLTEAPRIDRPWTLDLGPWTRQGIQVNVT
jgi:hypothetical protein